MGTVLPSSTALTVELLVQLIAGRAKPFALAYARTFITSSPFRTPGGTTSLKGLSKKEAISNCGCGGVEGKTFRFVADESTG